MYYLLFSLENLAPRLRQSESEFGVYGEERLYLWQISRLDDFRLIVVIVVVIHGMQQCEQCSKQVQIYWFSYGVAK